MAYSLNIAPQGYSEQRVSKIYSSADTAIRSGKILLVNHANGRIYVYDEDEQLAAAAAKIDWCWSNMEV